MTTSLAADCVWDMLAVPRQPPPVTAAVQKKKTRAPKGKTFN